MNRPFPHLDAGQRDKAIRLLDYLLKVAALRSTPIRDVEQYEKVLWLSKVPRDRGCYTQAWGDDQGKGRDEWLEVQNRREPSLPPIPSCCSGWVDESALSSKDQEPRLLSQIKRELPHPQWREDSDLPETIVQIQSLDEHPEVKQAWQRYLSTHWRSWKQEHNAWQALHQVYSTLFAIHQSQVRLGEEYELVLGLGLLLWQSPSGQRVRRHLIVADAFLEFDACKETFSARSHPDGARLRLELDMLDADQQPLHAEATAKAKLAAAQDDPWDKDRIEQVLKEIIHRIDSRGRYDPALDPTRTAASGTPVVVYAPALILRKRSTKGLTETLLRIKQSVQAGGPLTPQFADIAEVCAPNPQAVPTLPSEHPTSTCGTVFFPKPWNAEQRRIVETLQRANCVLVQGPPGTGKSHTIANLICHLLATGQRCLITAKTPRALLVLERLLPEELRPLCINLLGNAPEERRSLEASVQGILSKNETWNATQAAEQANRIEQRLHALREEKALLSRRLRELRECETRVHTLADGAYRGTAAQIAQAVDKQQTTYGWFTDSVPLDRPCPVKKKILQKIVRDLREFPSTQRAELHLALPQSVPSSDDLRALFTKETQTAISVRERGSAADMASADRLAIMPVCAIDQMRDLLLLFRQTYMRLSAVRESWVVDALGQILAGGSHMWHELARATRAGIDFIAPRVARAESAALEIPAGLNRRQAWEDACRLQQHLERHHSLGWWILRPRHIGERLSRLKAVKLSGRRCKTAQEFAVVAEVLQVRLELDKLWAFWVGRAERVEGPYSLQLAALRTLCDRLEALLAIEQVIDQTRDVIRRCSGLSEPTWTDTCQIDRLLEACTLARARAEQRGVAAEVERIEADLSRAASQPEAHPVAKKLLSAFRSRDLDAYQQSVATLERLKAKQDRLKKAEENLSLLGRVLPEFKAALEQTLEETYWDERIDRLDEAWRWAQARSWVAQYARQDDAQALAQRARQIEDEINKNVAQLAALHAWRLCFGRLREEHRRHMEGWRQSMRRLGKGTGKHAYRHRADAQAHLSHCRDAVPAWVMPLHRIWDTVDPAPGIFDVIIVDEASQCGFEALPLFLNIAKTRRSS